MRVLFLRDGFSGTRRNPGQVDVCPFGMCADAHSVRCDASESLLLVYGRLRGHMHDERQNDHRFAEALRDAFHRRGLAFVQHLEGEYALALIESNGLTLARDPAGAYPLYYRYSAGTLYFSTSVRALTTLAAPYSSINREHAARWLLLEPRTGATFFGDIQSIPPGGWLHDQGREAAPTRWWKPEQISPEREGEPSGWVQELRNTLQTAVRDRIRSEPGATHLSGGLDSSAVTALAAIELGERRSRLQTYTAVPVGTAANPAIGTKFSDERALAATTARRYGLNIELVPNNASGFFPVMDLQSSLEMGPGLNPLNSSWIYGIAERAAADGRAWLLVGFAGNLTISYGGSGLVPLLVRQHRFNALWRVCRGRQQRLPGLLRLARSVASASLPASLLPWVRHDRPAESYRECVADLLSPALMQETKEIAAEWPRRESVESSVGLRWRVLERADHGSHFEAMRRHYGLCVSDPLADRCIVELCFRIPEELYLHEGEPRWLLRQAMKDLLPPAVLGERRRGLQSADWHATLSAELGEIRREVGRWMESTSVRSILNVPAVERLVAEWPSMPNGSAREFLTYGIVLPRILSLGRFLRRHQEGSL